MKVLLALHQLGTDSPGGVEAHVLDVAGELARRGHDVSLLAGDGGGLSRDPPGSALRLRIIRRTRPSTGLGRLLATVSDESVDGSFEEILAVERPDVVHIHHFMYLSMGLLEVAERCGIRCICTVHDHGPACHRLFLWTGRGTTCDGPGSGLRCGPCNLGDGLRGLLAAPAFALRQAIATRWMRRMPLVLSPSRYLAGFFVRHGVPSERVRVMELGISPASRSAPARLRSSPVRFGFAGTLRPHKGAHVLLEAFALLDRGLAELVVHGNPEVEPGYGGRVRALAAASGARIVPPFERARIDEALAALDCVVMPSLAAENAPMLARECLARRLPMVASRVGGLPEVAGEGRGITYCEPGDVAAWARKLDFLARNPAELDRLAAAAAEPRSLASHVAELERLYLSLQACLSRPIEEARAQG